MQYSNDYNSNYDRRSQDAEDRDDYAAYMRDPAWHEQSHGPVRGRGRQSRGNSGNRIKNVSTIFLNECRKQKLDVVICTVDEISYRGSIDAFDQQGLILASEDSQILIYYAHIISITAVHETPYLTG